MLSRPARAVGISSRDRLSDEDKELDQSSQRG